MARANIVGTVAASTRHVVSAAAINGRSRGTIGTLNIRFSRDARRFASERARLARFAALSIVARPDSDTHPRSANDRIRRISEYLEAARRLALRASESNGRRGKKQTAETLIMSITFERYRAAYCTFGRLPSLRVPVARCTMTRPMRLNNNGIISKVSGITSP